MSTHTALEVDADGAVAFHERFPDYFIFPGRMVEDPDTGEWRKRPAPGMRWNVHATTDPDKIRELWAEAGGRGVIAVATAPSDLWVLDEDRDVDEEWAKILDAVRRSRGTLVLQSCTKGRPHYVFRQGAEYVAEGTWPGGDVKATGYIFVSSLPPLVDAGVQVAPKALLAKLKKGRPEGGHGRGMCSTGDLWDWLSTTPEPEDLILRPEVGDKFIDRIIGHMHDVVDGGDHRRQAARAAVYQAAIEAAAGCYSAETAYTAIKDAYRALRESRGEHGERGWTRDRERDYDFLWQSLIPAIAIGDLDAKIAATRDEALERYPRFDDDDMTDDEVRELFERIVAASALSTYDVTDISAPTEVRGEPVSEISESVPPPSTGASTGEGTPSTGEDWKHPSVPSPPPPLTAVRSEPKLNEAAFWGPHGDLIDAVRGRTESSDAGLIGCLLAFSGAVMAGRAHFQVGVDVHGPNDFVLNIGASSAARKSSALSLVDKGIFYDPALAGTPTSGCMPRKLHGIASGEILVKQWMPTKEEDGTGKKIEVYPERRVLMIESEASVVWKRAQRQGALLSDIYCKIWDQTDLATAAITSGSTYVPHDKHLMAFIGCSTLHIAVAAAKAGDGTDAKSGFGNRFLWMYLPDSKIDLPFGADLPSAAVRRYQDALGLTTGTVAAGSGGDSTGFGPEAAFDPIASERWREVYGTLKRDKGAAGFIEGMLSRGESHVLRIALNYWLASGGDPKKVGLPALEAALAVWKYAKESVEYIFGDSTGDRDSDNLVAELATRGGWATMMELRADLNKNSLAGLVKQGTDAGVLKQGSIATGLQGRPPRAVCIAQWLKTGQLAHESSGVLRGRGTSLSSVTWD